MRGAAPYRGGNASLDRRARLARACRHRSGGGAAALLGRRSSTPVLRASWTRTPGVAQPAVTQTTIRSTICRPGGHAPCAHPSRYTNDLKRRGLLQYGLRGPPSAYQEDHLISLELGGSPIDPREPLARAVPARRRGRQDRERAQPRRCARLDDASPTAQRPESALSTGERLASAHRRQLASPVQLEQPNEVASRRRPCRALPARAATAAA